ncbi:F-box DNA helicase 1-like [Procambarus clarkii]|uniref:F-box DNA helicase 1-like n=1 Tax=Procambarus clarkii TaxID=6728 RepID=UPI003744A376
MCSEVDFNLPSEVLEMVFSHVPLVHLLTVDATVCRYWYTVILNPAFIPWRKVHHRLKLAPWRVPSNMPLHQKWESEKLPTIHIISTHCQHHGFTSVRDCIPSVIKMMGSRHGPGAVAATKLVLERHRLYTLASDTLENMEEALMPRPFNLWHVATLIVFLSVDVWDVERAVDLLLHPHSSLTYTTVTEAFYCLATLLIYCTDHYHFPRRIVHLAALLVS